MERAVGVMFAASFAMLCPDGYGYVKEGESMEGWRIVVPLYLFVAYQAYWLINSTRLV